MDSFLGEECALMIGLHSILIQIKSQFLNLFLTESVAHSVGQFFSFLSVKEATVSMKRTTRGVDSKNSREQFFLSSVSGFPVEESQEQETLTSVIATSYRDVKYQVQENLVSRGEELVVLHELELPHREEVVHTHQKRVTVEALHLERNHELNRLEAPHLEELVHQNQHRDDVEQLVVV